MKRLGYEEDYMTVGEYESLRKALPCEMVPATKLVMDLRSVKDQAEIDCLIAAQRIAEKALTETLNFIQVGRTEREIAAYLQYKMLSYGGEKMSFEPIVVSGPNSSMPHGRALGQAGGGGGTLITMDFGCVKYGYCSDMTRTVAVGHVTEEMEKVYHTVAGGPAGGHCHGPRPASPARAVHEAGAKVIADAATAPTSATASATVWVWRFMSSPGRLPPAPIPCLWAR